MSDVLRYGLIGCGRVAPRHAQSLGQIANAKLVAVADERASRAEHFGCEYNAAPYTSYAPLLERDDIDAVCICVPSGLHAQVALDALDAGKHVLVEKPIALHLDDADAMIARAKTIGKSLGVVLQNRYNHPMLRLRALIDREDWDAFIWVRRPVRWYRPQSYTKMDGTAPKAWTAAR